jgi:acetolactate synthase-1/2/3 large subunit
MTKASDLFVQCLEAEGVEYIFGVPGEENLDMLDSLSRSTKIKLILTRHEQGAGFMAATYGRHTGKAGVCMATLGPGATNFVTAAAYAQLGGMPMLMVTGQKPIKKSKQGRFQILDVVDMMKPITKFTHQLASADNIPSRVREAFRLAEEEKPGAAHIEFPEDIAEEKTESVPLKPSSTRRPNADKKSIRAAVTALEQARSPILVIGAGANRTMTSRMLLQFIEKTGIPFLTTQLGKGVIDERHPKFLGCAALSAGDFVHRAVEAADLIVNIGHDVIEKPPFFMQPRRHAGDPCLDQDGRGRSGLFPRDRGDRRYRQRDLADEGRHRPQWRVEVRPYARLSPGRARTYQRRSPRTRASRSSRRYLVQQIREAMPDDGIICLDNGVYKIWFARGYCACIARTPCCSTMRWRRWARGCLRR